MLFEKKMAPLKHNKTDTAMEISHYWRVVYKKDNYDKCMYMDTGSLLDYVVFENAYISHNTYFTPPCNMVNRNAYKYTQHCTAVWHIVTYVAVVY